MRSLPFWTLFALLGPALVGAGGRPIVDHDEQSWLNQATDVRVVTFSQLESAMAEESRRGYDAKVQTNAARFFADVVFNLARGARHVDPEGLPLLIRHQDWFRAFLNVHQLSAEEARLGLRLAYQYQQDVLVDYRDGKVVEFPDKYPDLHLALNVQVSWPKSIDGPDSYSFEDTLSTPKVRLTNRRVIRIRLLDFGDMIAYDQVEGMTGRPISGFLAPVFAIIGDGQIVRVRLAITPEGYQIARAKAKKGFFSVAETITVDANGVLTKGLPDDSPELVAIEDRLKSEIEIEYAKWSLPESVVN